MAEHLHSGLSKPIVEMVTRNRRTLVTLPPQPDDADGLGAVPPRVGMRWTLSEPMMFWWQRRWALSPKQFRLRHVYRTLGGQHGVHQEELRSLVPVPGLLSNGFRANQSWLLGAPVESIRCVAVSGDRVRQIWTDIGDQVGISNLDSDPGLRTWTHRFWIPRPRSWTPRSWASIQAWTRPNPGLRS